MNTQSCARSPYVDVVPHCSSVAYAWYLSALGKTFVEDGLEYREGSASNDEHVDKVL